MGVRLGVEGESPHVECDDFVVRDPEGKPCVLPLSASGILNRTPERQMGLRHRAALGTSEASDAIAVVVSEETGGISIAHAGRMLRRLDPDRLENILIAFFRPHGEVHKANMFERLFPGLFSKKEDK